MAAEDKVREPRATSLLVSVVFHSLVALGIAASSWWWGASTLNTWKTYTVSLVDVPLSLRSSPPSPVRPQTLARPKPTAPPPKMPTVTEPAAPPAVSKVTPSEKPKVDKPAPPSPAPLLSKVAKPSPELKTKSIAVAAPTPAEPPRAPQASTSQEARSAVEVLRQRQALRERTQQQAAADDDASREQAVSARVAELRDQLAQEQSIGDTAVMAAGVQRVRLIAYQDGVRSKIIESWILPLSSEQTRDLQATAQFQVARDGQVMQLELIKPSGNRLFDASLLRAIRRASPLPALPDDYRVDVLEVEMRFRAES